MGFFSDLWSGIKNVAGNVWSAVKQGTNWVADKVQPIVKTVADYASYVPVVGAGISGVAQQLNKGIDLVKNVIGKVDTVASGVNKAFSRSM